MNKNDLELNIFVCPICKSSLEVNDDKYSCKSCQEIFPQTNAKFINLFPDSSIKEQGFESWETRQKSFLNWVDKIWEKKLAEQTKGLYIELANFIGDIDGLTLDIGCCQGYMNNWLKNTSYIGIDPFEGWVTEERPDFMRELYPVDYNNFIFIKGLGELLPMKNSSFKNILMLNTLDHSSDPYKMLTEANRVLKKEGQLFIMHENPSLINKIVSAGFKENFRRVMRKMKRIFILKAAHSDHIHFSLKNLNEFLRDKYEVNSEFSKKNTHIFLRCVKK